MVIISILADTILSDHLSIADQMIMSIPKKKNTKHSSILLVWLVSFFLGTDVSAFGAGIFSWQDPVHSWKAGPCEVVMWLWKVYSFFILVINDNAHLESISTHCEEGRNSVIINHLLVPWESPLYRVEKKLETVCALQYLTYTEYVKVAISQQVIQETNRNVNYHKIQWYISAKYKWEQ